MAKKNKQYNTIALSVLFLVSMLAASPANASEENEVMPANRTQLSLLFGSYTLTAPSTATTTTGTTISSIGAFTVGFSYRFFEKIAANAAYNNLMTFNGKLSSVVSGFDIGASYCFFTCSAMRQKLGDAALAVTWSPWGVQLGLGFAQRSIQLSNLSVGFAGPYGKVEVNYMLGDRFKALGAVQYSTLANSTKSLTQMTMQFGFGFDFGENVYNSVQKRSN